MIDLKAGQAVHAVAGVRDRYRPLEFCRGNAVSLAAHFASLGISSLYIADLDALQGGEVQERVIRSILGIPFRCVLIDIGWTGTESKSAQRRIWRLATEYCQTRWIAATETCSDVEAVDSLADQVEMSRVVLGLDFHDGQFVTRRQTYEQWSDVLRRDGLSAVLVLDTAAVGTGRGPATIDTCRKVRAATACCLYSGGGVRSIEDVSKLTSAGCDQVLVATALLPIRAIIALRSTARLDQTGCD